MNKLKKFSIIFASIIISLYILFFILVYAFGNLNSYIPELQKIVKDSIGLYLDINSAKLAPTPKMEIKLTVDDIIINYPNKDKIASVDKLSIKIPVLPIILGDIKLSEINIDNPKGKFKLSASGDVDLIEYIEPYLEKMQKEKDENTESKGLLKYFRISNKMPDIKIKKYNAEIFDESINQTVLINGEYFDIVKFDLTKGLKVITKGQVKTEKQIFSNYDLNIETFLPKFEENKVQTAQTAFIDPFKNMLKYEFYTDVFTDLKISENITDGVNIKGDLDIKSLNLKSKTTDTKGTYVKLKFDKNTINVDSQLFLTKSQNAKIILPC